MGLEIQNLTKSYGATPVLKGINLSLNAGEIVGFLGLNGAGKTTLMKILTGALTQWEGEIKFNGKNLKEHPTSIQQNIGYLPENNPLYGEMYVLEYLRFTAQIYGAPQSNLKEVLQKTGLELHTTKQIKTLSKGYKQRVGMAAALLHHPEFLILDEPTTGLDPQQLVEIRKLIKTIGKTTTVFLSTHIMQEVEALCDRVLILHNGKIVFDSPLTALAANQQQVIKVSFDYRVETEALARIPKVERVVNTFDFDYEIYCSTDADMRPAIFDFAHDNDLKIRNLQHKIEDLEKKFRALTQD